MDWLDKLKVVFPFGAHAMAVRQTIVRLYKVNVAELEVCKPKGFLRERSFGRTEKLDFYHLGPDGTIKHTPGN